MRGNSEQIKINQTATTLVVFMESYNKSIPEGFPRASTAILKKFQIEHQMLFKHGDSWSVDRHRKKVMDWLSDRRNLS
ncbi:hypothetical protein A2841_02670 [Candidatus Kaiserbacteria bacterium RIFCSPHIGHO2_01_FULL_48_10]|uniref:Uncharacterized protein n=1 Tax=Candidatus Kaiserbacteria bacterium RIFCSPHIGHO2_01_FULL_48_10 TaxID=1798476 RepID=A0A1F6C1U0_9BACT|nr:MAG: hypothetical protein A2841_02670 [Candidatus Kaiserbacteria bacterium RIFCSPHIGHO2_01_FULL_48_10]